MRGKGFTLVELLAVIVILAIILAIAIPSITGIIDDSKLNSFNINSKTLKMEVKKYLILNNIIVGDGETKEILYSDLKTAGYIEKIVDPKSNNECIHSRVYITNNGGIYTYKVGLVCDNYMDIDTYNIITNNDFSNGTTGWSDSGSSDDISIMNGDLLLTCTGSTNYGVLIYNSGNDIIIGNKIYYKITTRVTNSNCLYFYSQIDGSIAGTNVTIQTINSPIQNQWYTLSGIGTIGADFTGKIKFTLIQQYSNTTIASGKVLEVNGSSGAYAFDLTSIYGAGNEPTKAQMDNIINNMID